MIQKTVIDEPGAIMGRKTGGQMAPVGGVMRRNARWWLRLTALTGEIVRRGLMAPLLVLAILPLGFEAAAENRPGQPFEFRNRQPDLVLEFQHGYRWQTAYFFGGYIDRVKPRAIAKSA